MKNILRRYSVFIVFLSCLLSGVWLFYLSARPFGALFISSYYLFATCVVILLIIPFVKGLQHSSLIKRLGCWFSGAVGVLLATMVITFHFTQLAAPSDLSGQSAGIELSKKAWQEDLNYLVNTVKHHHPVKREAAKLTAFESASQLLKSRLSAMTVNQKLIAFNKLLANLNDGHSSMWPLFSPASFHSYPLKTFSFSDGLYIVDSSRQYQSHIGSKIVGIGKFSIDEIRKRLREITGAENDIGEIVRLSLWLTQAELLKAEGIIDDANSATFHLENQRGERYKIQVSPESSFAWSFWTFYRPLDKNALPFTNNIRSDFYWFELDRSTNTLYFQFNLVQDKFLLGESLADFAKRLDAFASNNQFDRLVIDLRNNNGGNGQLLHPLINVIAKNRNINRPGKLFALVGRYTFSAAALFASALENRTNTIFVGESLGVTPNFYGDAEEYLLPNSGFKLLLSNRYWLNSHKSDLRSSIQPEIVVDYQYADFINGIDPALERIFAFEQKYESNLKVADNILYSLSQSEIDELLGEYQFSETQLAKIFVNNGQLRLSIDDFSPRGFSKVETPLTVMSENLFHTNISGVSLHRITEHRDKHRVGLYFDWHGIKINLAKIFSEPPLPMKLLQEKKYEEAFYAIKQGRSVPLHIDLESTLNNIAYHFAGKNLLLAIEIADYNANQHNYSSNTFDTLGELQLLNGERSLAISSYEKALKLNPDNDNARKVLSQLK